MRSTDRAVKEGSPVPGTAGTDLRRTGCPRPATHGPLTDLLATALALAAAFAVAVLTVARSDPLPPPLVEPPRIVVVLGPG